MSPPRDFSEYGRRRRVVGGIETRARRGAFTRNWWGTALVDAVEGIGDTGRLARGRTYARGGQVVALEIAAGMIRAEVQGSQLRPFEACVSLAPLTAHEVDLLTQEVRRQPGVLAALAGGTVPEVLAPLLLPDSPSAFDFDCTCPDNGWPCKHAAAIVYVGAERIDSDPLLILTLRGVRLDTLMEAVGDAQAPNDDDWYGEHTQLPRLPALDFAAAIEDLDPSLLRRALRTLGGGVGGVEPSIVELTSLYRRLKE